MTSPLSLTSALMCGFPSLPYVLPFKIFLSKYRMCILKGGMLWRDANHIRHLFLNLSDVFLTARCTQGMSPREGGRERLRVGEKGGVWEDRGERTNPGVNMCKKKKKRVVSSLNMNFAYVVITGGSSHMEGDNLVLLKAARLPLSVAALQWGRWGTRVTHP